MQGSTYVPSEVQSGTATMTCGYAFADKPFLNPEVIHYSPAAAFLLICVNISIRYEHVDIFIQLPVVHVLSFALLDHSHQCN